MITTIKPMVAHRVAGQSLGPIEGAMFEYVMAGNGLFVRAQREGLYAVVRIARATVRGIPEIEPAADLSLGRIPSELISEVVRNARIEATKRLEALYHFTWDGGWKLEIPPQEQKTGSVRPTVSGPGSSYQRAIVEVHSHHAMRADFSVSMDDVEQVGFRVYGVLGRLGIDGKEEIRWRVGVYGYFMDIPTWWITDDPRPEGLIDCASRDARIIERWGTD